MMSVSCIPRKTGFVRHMSDLVRNHPRFYVGNLPWLSSPDSIETQMQTVLDNHGFPEARLEVVRFEPSKSRKPSDMGKLHHGHGYIYVDSNKMESLMSALKGGNIFGNEMRIGHITHPLPEFVPKPIIPDSDAIEKARLARLRRKEIFKNKNKRRVDMLRQFIKKIPLPGGPTALNRYVRLPTMACSTVDTELADTSIDWSTMPNSVDPGYDFKRNVPLGDNPRRERILRLHRKDSDPDSLPMFSGQAQLVGRASAIVGAGQEHAGMTTRAVRKRYQAGSFYAVLRRLLSSQQEKSRVRPIEIVDFASGSGNLCLPLAYLFPECSFTAVDMKDMSIEILLQRAKAAGLTNVKGVVGRIEAYSEPFDIALALHACGDATDYSMVQAERNRAAYVVCPCCIGKLSYRSKESEEVGDEESISSDGSAIDMDSFSAGMEALELCRDGVLEEISHPRSRWLTDAMARHDKEPQRLFAAMARAGDISHGSAHSHSSDTGRNHTHEDVARVCKCHLELDRNMYMAEKGYETALMRLLRDDLTGKGDLLVGVPAEVLRENRMQRPWDTIPDDIILDA